MKFENDYYGEMQEHLNSYKERFGDSTKKAAFRFAVWNALYFLFGKNEKVYTNQRSELQRELLEKNLNDSKLNIAFLANGGIGDFVVLANYIYKFKQKFYCPNMQIDIFYERNEEAAKALFGSDIADNQYTIANEILYRQNIHRKYDLFIDVSRYPDIRNRNLIKINCFQPLLVDYMLEIERFKLKNPRFKTSPVYDGQTAMVNDIFGKKRIDQIDIEDFLKLSEEYEYKIPYNTKNERNILSELGIKNNDFIVIVDGADYKNGGIYNNKIWPDIYYEELLHKIKEKYPDKSIVQIGTNCPEFENIDINLINRTSFEQTKILLKNASLLIGNEGGMVHLRYALHGGKSIVLFGPTDINFFGYSSNINIRGKGCAAPCEWIYRNWTSDCVNKEPQACMWSITPMMVMQKVTEFFKGAAK